MILRWALPWLVLLAVLAAIGGAAAAGIGHFRSSTDRARRTEFALTDAQSAAYAANAAEWKMIARRRADPAEDADFLREVAGIQSKLVAIAAADPTAAPLARHVSVLVGRYSRAAAAEVSALRRGAVSSATAVDDNRVDPLFAEIGDALSRDVRQTEVRRAHAEQQ